MVTCYNGQSVAFYVIKSPATESVITSSPNQTSHQNAKPRTPNFTSMFTHRAEVGILGNIMCQSIVTGRCCHDQQQRVPGLLSNGSFPMDEWHEQGEYQKIRRALLSWCRLEQLFKNHRLPGHGHTDLVGMHKVYIFLAVIINWFIYSVTLWSSSMSKSESPHHLSFRVQKWFSTVSQTYLVEQQDQTVFKSWRTAKLWFSTSSQ